MKKPPTIEELRDKAEARAYAHANGVRHMKETNVYDFGRVGVLVIRYTRKGWSPTWLDGIIKLQGDL